MKTKTLSLLASIALLSLVSCTDEVQELAGEQSQALKQIVMTTQDFQPETDSRTVYQIADGAVKCTWATNDTVGVFPNEGAQVYFPMTSGAGTKNATFDGKGWALKDGYTYGAYYPFIADILLDRNAVPVSYTGQTQVGNGSMAHLGDYDYMVATPTAPEFGSAQFMFKHLSALVQLKVTVPQPATFTSVKLVTDTKAFAVKGKVDVMAKSPVITPVTSNSEVVLSLQNVATTKENEVVTFYFMLPPADLSGKTLKAVLASEKGDVEVDLESKNFKAGTIYLLSEEKEGAVAGYKDGVVTITEAGTMKQLLGDDYLNITSLKVVGPINGDDVRCLRQMLGGDIKYYDKIEKGKLTSLDLSDASIVKGGSCYYSDYYSEDYYTSNDRIGDRMFCECGNLQDIVLPVGVTSIGDDAFRDCSSQTSIDIPEGVTSIGDEAFRNCSSLKSVHITDLSAWFNIAFENVESNPLNQAAKLYLNNQELTEVVIPADIKQIKNYAFCGYKALTKVTMSESVTSIGDWAFSYCSSLTSIAIPESVTSIGNYAFRYCSSLTSIDIPEGVTSIGDYAFWDCSSLTSIDIPESVTSIGGGAFFGCSSLTSIAIPEDVTSIGNNAFYGCSSLTSIDIPEGVTSIGGAAFLGCSSLTSIAIPEGVTSIGNGTFSGCSSLTSIAIPGGVTSIANYAFDGCSSLTSIAIPKSVTSIGRSAFDGCSSLTSIDIPEGVTSIEDYTFYNCSSLTSIAIPEGVTSIGAGAFVYCSSLTQVYCYGTTPPTINSPLGSSFNGSKDGKTLYVPKGYLSVYQSSDWANYFGTITEMD